MKVSLRKKLDEISIKHNEIQNLLSDKDIINDMDKYKNLSVEYAKLEVIIKDYKKYLINEESLQESEEISKNETGELKKLADEEIKSAKEEISQLEKNLEISLLPEDPNDKSNVFLEIRAGTGGLEAAIFAGDLYKMYTRFAERSSWKVEPIEITDSDMGGYSKIIFAIKSKGVYSKLKFEAGAHRVQRVPKTESQGRVHTSIATVAVLPEAEDVDINIDQNDLKVDVYRSSGPGGQSVNTTDSAVRITHIPTGLVVSCQDEKSQLQNKEKAMRILRARLLKAEQEKAAAERAKDRKEQVGSGERSDKIRTYNYKDNRVSDHRINLTLKKLDQVLDGDLDEFVDALVSDNEASRLANLDE